jgi:predicted DsbA family dithiol-disulfide isomerase
MQVEIFSDVVCPWCYLGKRRFERALAEFEHGDEVTVVHRSFQLDPSAPDGPGEPTVEMLSSKYGMTVEQAEQMQRQMEQRAAADGLEYHLDGQLSGNTYRAHRLLQLARERGRQDELTERLFAAHFTERRSVFDDRELVDLCAEAGLDRAEAERVLAGNDYAAEVEHDLADARALGITGVPFFVIDRRFGVSGAQPAEVLANALRQAHQAAQPAPEPAAG